MRTIAIVLLLAACDASRETVPSQRDFPAKRVEGSAEVKQRVDLLEYQINMSDSVTAGKQTFSVANAGKEEHALEIEGNGVHVSTEKLAGGGTATLAVELKPGAYDVYCPVEGHKDKGMKRTLVVR